MEDIGTVIGRILDRARTAMRDRAFEDGAALAGGSIFKGSWGNGDMLGALRIKNSAPDQLGDLGDESVSGASSSVHPMGIPIIHSRNLGFIRPGPPRVAIATGKLGEWTPCGFGFLPSFQSRACGVGSVPACRVSYPRKTVRRSPLPPLSASDALGVGRLFRTASAHPSLFGFVLPSPLDCSVRSFPALHAVGVGNDPNPVALVRGAEGLRWYAIPLSIKPALGHVPKNDVQPISKQSCHVLQDRVDRSNHANGTHQFPVESRTGTGQSGALACVGNVLAGESADDNISIGEFRLRYIAEIGNVRPMPGENSTGVWIVFAVSNDFVSARPFKAEAEHAGAAEHVYDFQHPTLPEKSPVVIAKAGKPPLAVWEETSADNPPRDREGWPRGKPAMGDRPFRLRPHTAQDAHKGEGATLPQSEGDNTNISPTHDRCEHAIRGRMIGVGQHQPPKRGAMLGRDGDRRGTGTTDSEGFGEFEPNTPHRADQRRKSADNQLPAQPACENADGIVRVFWLVIAPDRADKPVVTDNATVGEHGDEYRLLAGQPQRSAVVRDQPALVDIEDHLRHQLRVKRRLAFGFTLHRHDAAGVAGFVHSAHLTLGNEVFPDLAKKRHRLFTGDNLEPIEREFPDRLRALGGLDGAAAEWLGHSDTSATVTRSPTTSHRSMIDGQTGTCPAPVT